MDATKNERLNYLSERAAVPSVSKSKRLAENDDWPAGLASVFASTGAFALPAESKDTAVLLTLQPGFYTAVLSGPSANGEGLIETTNFPKC